MLNFAFHVVQLKSTYSSSRVPVEMSDPVDRGCESAANENEIKVSKINRPTTDSANLS